MKLGLTLVLAFACLTGFQIPSASAQQVPAPPTVDAPAPQPDLPVASPAATPALPPPPSTIPGFAAHESCTFPDRLAIVDRTPINAGIATRSAETSHGNITVQLEASERILFAYPAQDLFATLKLEKLPAKDYLGQKQTLIEDFNHTLAQSPLGARNYSLPKRLCGFEIYGLDRIELSGSVLGVYLFFDDLNRIATTIYFLNQDASTRPFQTVDQYAALRDQFLKTYTVCIRTGQGVPVEP